MPETTQLFDKLTLSLHLTAKTESPEMTSSIQERKFEGIAPPAGQFYYHQDFVSVPKEWLRRAVHQMRHG